MTEYFLNADTGNDSTGDGSSGTPWKTVGKAHTSASSGDTITCQDSTATYTFTDQQFTKNLTIQGQSDDGSGAVFDGASAARAWYADSGTVTISLSKLTFQNIYGGALSQPNWGIFEFRTTTTISFTSCIFKSLQLVRLSGEGGGVVSTHNNTDLVYSLSIANCAFFDISKRSGSTDDIVVLDFSRFASGSTISIVDTVIAINDITGFAAMASTRASTNATATVTNSIFYANSSLAWDVGGAQPTYTSTYNTFYNLTGYPDTSNNLTSDPLLVDLANGNLNLRPTSPARWAGV